MIIRIENKTCSYAGNNVVNVSATLNIYAVEGSQPLHSQGLEASYNLAAEDFPAEIRRQVSEQVNATLTRLAELDTLRQQHFPTSVSFDDALQQLFKPIEQAIGG